MAVVRADYFAPRSFADRSGDGTVVVPQNRRNVLGQENRRLAGGGPDYGDIGQSDQVYP
jgi:hypothetical protein